MLTELTLGQQPLVVSAEAAEEPQQEAEYAEEVCGLASHFYDVFEASSTKLSEEAIKATSSNSCIRAMQLAMFEHNKAAAAAGRPRMEPLAIRPIIAKAASELPEHLRLFLEWVAAVRVALLDIDPAGRRLKYDICGTVAALYHPRYQFITDICQISRDAVPLLVMQPADGAVPIRMYTTSINPTDGFVVGGRQGCLFAKDLWISPAVRSMAALAESLKARGKSESAIERMIASITQERARTGLQEGFYPELWGAAMNLESTDLLVAALQMVEAIIAEAVITRKNKAITAIASKIGLPIEDIAAGLQAAEPGTLDKVGERKEEFIRHYQARADARERLAFATPFVLVEPYLAYSEKPDYVATEDCRTAPTIEAVLVGGECLAKRQDLGLLLRHNRLVRTKHPQTGEWIPKIFMDFGPVVEASGYDAGDGAVAFRPQVMRLHKRIDAADLREQRPSMVVKISKEDTRWKGKKTGKPTGKSSNSSTAST